MSEQIPEYCNLLKRSAAQDATAVGELFELHRERLRRMIHVRMDPRLQGRLDASDVLQEAFLEYARSLPEYIKKPEAPFYLWLRCLAERKLHALHRHHLGTHMRNAKREVSLHKSGAEASSVMLAADLLGKLMAPTQALLRAELQAQVQQALEDMEPIDREVLALRHYEQLNNRDTAALLGLSEAAASIRFIRALRRLKELLARVPGLLGEVDTNGEATDDR